MKKKVAWRQNYHPYKRVVKADLRDGSKHKMCEFSIHSISWFCQCPVQSSWRNLDLRHFWGSQPVTVFNLFREQFTDLLPLFQLSLNHLNNCLTTFLLHASPHSGHWKHSLLRIICRNVNKPIPQHHSWLPVDEIQAGALKSVLWLICFPSTCATYLSFCKWHFFFF